jgi:hypothetical protein
MAGRRDRFLRREKEKFKRLHAMGRNPYLIGNYVAQMLFVLFLILRIHEDIIDEHHYKLVKIVHEHIIHQVHEESSRIRQTDGHDCVLIKSILGDECCLWYVRRSDPELMCDILAPGMVILWPKA